MKHGDNHVVTGPCIIVWDAITRPNVNVQSNTQSWALKVVCPANTPDFRDVQELADKELMQGMWRGKLPVGGRVPVGDARPGEFLDMFPGQKVLNPKTTQGAPKVYDAAGNILSPMVYGPQLYQGAVVELMIHAFSYDNINKGVGFGLDAIRIVDATTPRLNLGGSGVDTDAVFGKPAASGPLAAVGAPPPPPAPEFLDPTGPPAGHTMTSAAAGTTYKAFRDAGWTDAQLISNGKMV
jgi:hypothetical protein